MKKKPLLKHAKRLQKEVREIQRERLSEIDGSLGAIMCDMHAASVMGDTSVVPEVE